MPPNFKHTKQGNILTQPARCSLLILRGDQSQPQTRAGQTQQALWGTCLHLPELLPQTATGKSWDIQEVPGTQGKLNATAMHLFGYYVFQIRVSLCSPCRPGTQEIRLSLPSSAGQKGVCHHASDDYTVLPLLNDTFLRESFDL